MLFDLLALGYSEKQLLNVNQKNSTQCVAYIAPCQTFKIEILKIIVNNFKPLFSWKAPS